MGWDTVEIILVKEGVINILGGALPVPDADAPPFLADPSHLDPPPKKTNSNSVSKNKILFRQKFWSEKKILSEKNFRLEKILVRKKNFVHKKLLVKKKLIQK